MIFIDPTQGLKKTCRSKFREMLGENPADINL